MTPTSARAVLHDVLAAVGDGRIQGGWEYVKAAYAIAWGGLGLYAVSLWARRPKGERP